MKKYLFPMILYLICFGLLVSVVYRMAFAIPPAPGTPGYKEFAVGTAFISISIGLMVVIPNLILEYLLRN